MLSPWARQKAVGSYSADPNPWAVERTPEERLAILEAEVEALRAREMINAMTAALDAALSHTPNR